jgi:hypothetical protein
MTAEVMEQESMREIDARIRSTFDILERVAEGVVSRHIRSAIVAGAAGCGKTHTLEAVLAAAAAAKKISYSKISGTMSALMLYQELYAHAEEGQVLLIDDCDSIFGDLEALNILKAALDSGKTRKVHWNKASRVLDDAGVPNLFDFRGAVIFITNIDFTKEIEAEKRLTPHYKALMSRCMYIDMQIHTRREIFVRILQVVGSGEFRKLNGLSKEQVAEMVSWLNANLNRVRVLSIRTVLQLSDLVLTAPDWRKMAEAIILKKK